MKIPRQRRLALLGAGAMLAMVASVLAPMSATAFGPTAYAPGLTITKAWSGSVDNGGTATATITLDNTGAGMATQNDVVVVDTFDPGLTYTGVFTSSAGGTCVLDNTIGFRRVVCTNVDVPFNSVHTITLKFTGSYWGYATYTKNYVTGERLEIQKAETHVDIESGQTETETVHCPANYDLIDYSWHLQHVDQDTGDFSDIYTVSSDVDNTSATVELFNDAGGKAQGKLWAVCLKDTTNQGHPVEWENPQYQTSEHLTPTGPNERPFYAECQAGYTPMAINLTAETNGFSDSSSSYADDLVTQTGLEADGSRRATVWAVVLDHAKVTLQWRCLNTKVSNHRMFFDVKTASKNVAAHDEVAEQQITCSHGYKGIIGGWRGGHFNGSEPRPVTRDYWLWHDGPGAKTFTGELLCLKSRLMRGGKLQKNGSVIDQLHNHVFGTTQAHAFYILNTDEADLSVTQN